MQTDRPIDVLFVTHRLPWPPDKGDRIRTWHLLNHLAGFARVHLAALADEPVPPEAVAALSAVCARASAVRIGRERWLNGLASLTFGGTVSVGAHRSAALRKLIAGWCADTPFAAAIASASSLAGYLREPARRGAVTVVDAVDVDSRKWLDYADASSFPKSTLYRTEGRRLARAERKMAGRVDAVTLVSEAESGIFAAATGARNVVTATNGVDLDYYRPAAAAEERGLVFVGAMDYRPNVDGACWFAKALWPALRHRVPGATLRIVGRKPVPAVLDLAAIPGVEVIGQVPDVRPYLAEAAIAIAPLRIARGLQNKVLEAMASGKPVIASPAAVAGFGHRDELPVVVADSPADWSDRIVALLADPAERRRLGEEGRRYAETYHDWSQCLEPFTRLIAAVPAGAGA